MLVCASPALDLLVQSAAQQPDSGVTKSKDEPQVATNLELQNC